MPNILSLRILGWNIGFTPFTLSVLAVVGVLFLAFIVLYSLPSLSIGRRLKSLTRQLRETKDFSPDKIGQLFLHTSLHRPWAEYEKTLHHEKIGGSDSSRIFATIPAKAIFNETVLVDTALKVEFFKHLPGILTGLGIIGTFFTLISGLQEFRVDLDPTLLQSQLEGLIKAVREAFVVSGLAIFFAILVTLLEKIRIHTLYRHVEDLSMALDGLYAGGVGEQYLSRLVVASEENAVQSRHLKDGLVNDLKQMLENLTTRQIEASGQHYQNLSNHMAKENERVTTALRESLQAPMESISHAVGALGQQRGEQVHGLLEDLLATFIDRLQGTLGQQMQDVSHMVTELDFGQNIKF